MCVCVYIVNEADTEAVRIVKDTEAAHVCVYAMHMYVMVHVCAGV